MTVREQIHETIAEIKRLRSIQKHHEAITQELQTAYNELNAIESQLVSELEDIEKLEKMSIKSVFYKVLGSQEEQLEKERQEYLQASLKHRELKKSIEILEYEHKIISTKVKEISGLEAKLNQLKKQRLQEIMASNDNTRLKITGIYHEMDQHKSVMEELRQAQVAGNNCLRSIALVMKHLKDAENWGNWDMTRKGGYYAQMKHGAIDSAVAAAQDVKHKLRVLDRELIDVNIEQTRLNINIDGFSRFMDIFFDNLISDWMIQRKIKNAINNVHALHDKIKLYIGVIEKEMRHHESTISTLDASIDDILLT